jgi:serine/threonine protein kinase
MGRVWAARQVGSPLQRLVAVKTAISGQSQTPEFQRLFMDEARIASLIHHPHVCGVYELGEEQGTLYLVMEWCDGSSLRQVMDKLDGRMDLAVAARIVANVAAGLHAAHELEDSDGTKLRVVHRDVSPQNVLIQKNGHVKVADFGVAKAQGQLHRPTETGEMKGKLAYMAPEQVTAKDIDHRADIFALGCVLYEISVGKRPFQGEGALSTLYQLLEQSVTPPTELIEGFPAELSAIVLKALAKEPDQRFQTAEDLRVALEGWIASIGAKASEREIAALLRKTNGEEIDERSRKINEAVAKLKDYRPSARPDSPGHSSQTTATAASPASHGRDGSSTVDRGVATGDFREKSSSWLLPVGAGLAVLGLVVVLAKGTLGTVQLPREPPPSNAAVVPSQIITASAPARDPGMVPDKPEAPLPPEPVQITVRTVPPNAILRIDDGAPMSAPYRTEQPPSGVLRVIRASAPGYVTATREVAFDRAQEILLDLEPVQSQRRPPKTRTRVEGPTTAPNPALEPAGPKPGETMPLPPKRPRALDEDNPFAR